MRKADHTEKKKQNRNTKYMFVAGCIYSISKSLFIYCLYCD